jgi:hypothetical protein
MATSEWGLFEWGAAEWGSAESADAPLSANIAMALTMVGSIQLAAEFVANIPMTMTVVGGLTTLIQMAADIPMVMSMEGPLFVARRTGVISTCGHPLSSNCDSWLLSIFQRPE